MSTWISAGAPTRRGGCTRASTYDGDVTGPSTSIAAAIPLARTVFPAPSGPDSPTTPPACSRSPNRDPSAMVSSTRSSVAVPDLSVTSATAPEPFPEAPVPQGGLARNRPVDEPDQPVVDRIGLVKQRQVTVPGDDDHLG